MTDQMSNDNLMTMVLVGLVVYMMLNNKKSCGCKEGFSVKKCGCSGIAMVDGNQENCSQCNEVAMGDEYWQLCNTKCNCTGMARVGESCP